MPAVLSRVFMNGNSQAVRIPQEFRLDAQGDLVIHPFPSDRGAALLDALQAFDGIDDAFLAALEADRRDPSAPQDRESL
jgi:antitoxin VapB